MKQETLEPLKALLRFVLFGTLGSFAMAFGTCPALVAALRVLQSETGAFHGNLSWLPYVIVSAPWRRRHRAGRLADHGRTGGTPSATTNKTND